MDLIVDHYFVTLEQFGDQVEFMEEEVVRRPVPATLQAVHHLKNDMIILRRSVWPLREVIARLERRESPLIQEATAVYFKDVYDHTIIAIDTVETYRDILSGLLDIYLSSVSNRLNEVMKVLTIIATIFMPLTFLAGVYGMNFKYMPELEWHWGYFASPGASWPWWPVAMVLYFKKRKWILIEFHRKGGFTMTVRVGKPAPEFQTRAYARGKSRRFAHGLSRQVGHALLSTPGTSPLFDPRS